MCPKGLKVKYTGLWVKDKNDIGTQIMIQVLAVLSQYEIELFTARGIDGKITALKTRGTTNGGPTLTATSILQRTANLKSTSRTCLFGADVQQSKLKESVHEYIECITLYKPSPLWVLVVVRFVDESERWGTIKNVRYAKEEVKRGGEF